MNIIGIDPSLVSTSITINGKKLFNYTKEKYATNKTGLNKWYKMCEQYITYRWINYENISDYSDSEISKLNSYQMIVSDIIKDIKENINIEEKTVIGIEGFSYSSNAGPLIDLVTFSTVLRQELLKITKEVYIIAPKSLKLESAKLTYPMVLEKKKETWRNKEGVSGGSFNKHNMYKALTENETIDNPYITLLRNIQDEVFETKTIKKPIEDQNDSFLIYEYLKNKFS